jgi:hypothetical protein
MRVGMGIRVGKEGHADQKFIRFGVGRTNYPVEIQILRKVYTNDVSY